VSVALYHNKHEKPKLNTIVFLQVLVGQSKKPSSQPVYEALIEEKFVDHIVILLSDQ